MTKTASVTGSQQSFSPFSGTHSDGVIEMKKILLCVSAAYLAIFPAQAAVRYDFRALSSFPAGPNDDQITGGFSYTAPSFITTTVNVAAANLSNCSVTGSVSGAIPCGATSFQTSPGAIFDLVAFGVAFPASPLSSVNYLFAPGAFAAAGTYQTIQFGANQAGTLTVTNLGVSAVPEPASWAMLIAGFGLVGGALRSRNGRRRVTNVSYA